jgi:hypothetical protein
LSSPSSCPTCLTVSTTATSSNSPPTPCPSCLLYAFLIQNPSKQWWTSYISPVCPPPIPTLSPPSPT